TSATLNAIPSRTSGSGTLPHASPETSVARAPPAAMPAPTTMPADGTRGASVSSASARSPAKTSVTGERWCWNLIGASASWTTTAARTANASPAAARRRDAISDALRRLGGDRPPVPGEIRMLVEAVFHDGLLGGAHLVEPPHGPVMGRVLQELRLRRRLARDLEHRVAERVEGLLRLGLRRLDHQ